MENRTETNYQAVSCKICVAAGDVILWTVFCGDRGAIFVQFVKSLVAVTYRFNTQSHLEGVVLFILWPYLTYRLELVYGSPTYKYDVTFGARSRNYCCNGKAMVVTKFCVSVTLIVRHVKRMRRISLSSVACLALT